MISLQKKSQEADFKVMLTTINPKYNKFFGVFSMLKKINYYLYIYLFTQFIVFLICSKFIEFSDSTFNYIFNGFGLAFLFNSLVSLASFIQQERILHKLQNNLTPYSIICFMHSFTLLLFLPSFISPILSMFISYLVFQTLYFYFMYRVEKEVENKYKNTLKN